MGAPGNQYGGQPAPANQYGNVQVPMGYAQPEPKSSCCMPVWLIVLLAVLAAAGAGILIWLLCGSSTQQKLQNSILASLKVAKEIQDATPGDEATEKRLKTKAKKLALEASRLIKKGTTEDAKGKKFKEDKAYMKKFQRGFQALDIAKVKSSKIVQDLATDPEVIEAWKVIVDFCTKAVAEAKQQQ